MNILIIDRDDSSAQLLKSRLESMGHEVDHEPAKDKAAEMLREKPYEYIFVDPSPMNSARQMVVNVRRSITKSPYLFLASSQVSQADAIKDGANDLIAKPYDVNALGDKMANAERLRSLVLRIDDTREDFPSAGGVIAKSAFNQLFLSGIDRAGRYGEQSYVLFIRISNYDRIKGTDGGYAADFASAQLSQKLVQIRRQSDIIGQTAKYEYALMLQPAAHPKEPLEAAARFADTLNSADAFNPDGKVPAEITVNLVVLPTGAELKEYVMNQE